MAGKTVRSIVREWKARKRIAVFAMIAVPWLLLSWSPWQPAAAPASTDEATAARTNAADRSPAASPPRPAPPGAAPFAANAPSLQLPPPRMADLVESVTVDKPRVCPGEDFVATIRGKPENARSTLPIAELNFTIGSASGETIALSADQPGVQRYTVVASNGVDKLEHRDFEVEVLPEDDPECAEKRFATLAVAPSRHESDVIEAKVVALHGLEAVVSYEWDFGDGTRRETASAAVTHSYALRDQTRTRTPYLVSVTARDAGGREARGRASIHLMNHYYRARAFGDRPLRTLRAAAVKKNARGYRVDVALRSYESEPVAFQRATLRQRSCLADRPDRTSQVEPAALALPEQLPANAAQTLALTVPKALLADDTCAVEIELVGDTVPPRTGMAMAGSPIPHRPVSARVDVELELAPPVEHGGSETFAPQPVEDEALLARLQHATQVLGTNRITPAQLAELERESTIAQPTVDGSANGASTGRPDDAR
jgi:PKD domain